MDFKFISDSLWENVIYNWFLKIFIILKLKYIKIK